MIVLVHLADIHTVGINRRAVAFAFPARLGIGVIAVIEIGVIHIARLSQNGVSVQRCGILDADFFINADPGIVKGQGKGRVAAAVRASGSLRVIITVSLCQRIGFRSCHTGNLNRPGQRQPGRQDIAYRVIFRRSACRELRNVSLDDKGYRIADAGVVGFLAVYRLCDGRLAGLDRYLCVRHNPFRIFPLRYQIDRRWTIYLHAVFDQDQVVAHSKACNASASCTCSCYRDIERIVRRLNRCGKRVIKCGDILRRRRAESRLHTVISPCADICGIIRPHPACGRINPCIDRLLRLTVFVNLYVHQPIGADGHAVLHAAHRNRAGAV